MVGEHLRFAGETVAWYRGPLAPAPLPSGTVRTPISCADAANRYDPSSGVFDVSYAAAWQLGQLLALQSSDFALALYNWRRDKRAASVAAAEQELIQQLLGDALPSLSARRRQFLPDRRRRGRDAAGLRQMAGGAGAAGGRAVQLPRARRADAAAGVAAPLPARRRLADRAVRRRLLDRPRDDKRPPARRPPPAGRPRARGRRRRARCGPTRRRSPRTRTRAASGRLPAALAARLRLGAARRRRLQRRRDGGSRCRSCGWRSCRPT